MINQTLSARPYLRYSSSVRLQFGFLGGFRRWRRVSAAQSNQRFLMDNSEQAFLEVGSLIDPNPNGLTDRLLQAWLNHLDSTVL